MSRRTFVDNLHYGKRPKDYDRAVNLRSKEPANRKEWSCVCVWKNGHATYGAVDPLGHGAVGDVGEVALGCLEVHLSRKSVCVCACWPWVEEGGLAFWDLNSKKVPHDDDDPCGRHWKVAECVREHAPNVIQAALRLDVVVCAPCNVGTFASSFVQRLPLFDVRIRAISLPSVLADQLERVTVAVIVNSEARGARLVVSFVEALPFAKLLRADW